MVVNIIIPVFNTEEYLKQCLDSVFNQTYKDIFVVCINDGSTDNSLSILESYSAIHENMLIINKKNGGLASSRNAGLDAIKSSNDSYVTFLDSDDYFETDFIEKMICKLEATNSDIVCAGYYDCESDGSINENIKYKNEIEFDTFESIKALFAGKLESHAPCKLYKSCLWNDFRYDESFRFMEDQCSTFKIFLKAHKVVYIPYGGYYYLHRVGSLCQSKMTNSKILNALDSYLVNYNFDFSVLGKKQNRILKKMILNQFATIFLMMYPRFDDNLATEIEIEKWNDILSFSKKTYAVFLSKSKNFKGFLKKYSYLLTKKLYKKIFKKYFLKQYEI